MASAKYDKERIVLVDMDEMDFSSDINTAFTTVGISTCIAFIIRGQCWIEDELKPFCGLYHWSGFPIRTKNQMKEIEDTLEDFFACLREDLDVDNNSILMLSELVFIGGEKCQADRGGEIILSGTEREVDCLTRTLIDFDFSGRLIDVKQEQIKQHHFLTSGDQSLSITVNLTNWSYLLDNPEPIVNSDGIQPDSEFYFSMR
ncbi:hypothetical protein BN59_03313 [Legionella massiliensis]|uniref:Uncharacterized protein n=1 Tax=Legionella massiliensis TaxID=1034943 RepID=A0A078L513_9GAMM|nr:hypothetical protein [Legionella massiliensis]CDZ78998.1 hypothetical protein BN59_03313 [Legionella massiliensis]CEE14736.1 hypothetical protein BN1094_03313 [Legionella massiliensis]